MRRMLYKGDYIATEKYPPGSIVRKADGSYHVYTRDNQWQPCISKPDPSDVGPAGRDGRDGTPGDPGQGFTFKGAWRKETSYVVNDVVQHNHAAWICIAPTSFRQPGVTAKSWELFVKGPKGEAGEKGERGGSGRGLRGPAGADAAKVPATFDGSMARGDVVRVSGDGIVSKALAFGSIEDATAIGLVTAPGEYQTSGPLTNDAWSLTPGTVYYLSPTVPGGITADYPTGSGQYVVIVGTALTPQKLNIAIHWLLVQP